MIYVLLCIIIISVLINIYFVINSTKLRAKNAKLEMESKNLQYELGKLMAEVKEKEDKL